jgi:hypothetical protein
MSKEKCLVLHTETGAVTLSSEQDIFCSTCGYANCICQVRKEHVEGCQYLTSMRCPVGIECEHGYDVCPLCDPCTCKEINTPLELASLDK